MNDSYLRLRQVLDAVDANETRYGRRFQSIVYRRADRSLIVEITENSIDEESKILFESLADSTQLHNYQLFKAYIYTFKDIPALTPDSYKVVEGWNWDIPHEEAWNTLKVISILDGEPWWKPI